MKLTFLSARKPLTKTITRESDGKLSKTSYAITKNFTSETIEINNLTELHTALLAKSIEPEKPCLLKGELTRALNNEPRKAATTSNGKTEFIVFDLDSAPFNDAEEFMRAVQLENISYVIQYSSSYQLDPEITTLSCHIFCLLSGPMAAPELKAWLMHLNLSTDVLKAAITLSNAGHALHWPLDITCSQNDKLIYIAEPNFINMVSPITAADRIQLIPKQRLLIDISTIHTPPMEALKTAARKIQTDLRCEAGLPKLKPTKIVGNYEVQKGVGEIVKYEVILEGEYTRINLNGWKNRAYWHHSDDFTLLHSFTGEPSMIIKEVLPEYYASMTSAAANTTDESTTLENIPFVFCNKVTGEYYKVLFNPETEELLELYKAKTLVQLTHYMRSHGKPLGEFIPEWGMIYDPHNPVNVDIDNQIINTFKPSIYMNRANQIEGAWPTIRTCLQNAVGTGEVLENTLNWLAVIFKHRIKTGTTQVWHGVQGTGKGFLANHIITPLLGESNCIPLSANLINQDFNGWMDDKLFVYIDEVDADMFVKANAVEAKLKIWVTEEMVTIRRMFTDSYTKRNFTNFAMASNQQRPVDIPGSDRRNNVCTYNKQRWLPSATEVETLKSGAELPAFAYFLQNHSADIRQAGRILQTVDRVKLQSLSLSSIDKLAEDLKTGNFSGLLDALPDESLLQTQPGGGYIAGIFTTLLERFATEPVSKVTRDELHILFKHCIGTRSVPEGAHKFTSYLNHHGIEIKPIRIGKTISRGFEIKWAIEPEDREYMLSRSPTKLRVVR